MPLLPRNTDYTDKDFLSLRSRLFNLIRSVFPTWTDYETANFGNMLVELYAHAGDVLTFYMDALALEGKVTTATQRRSLLSLGAQVGYKPKGASAATVDVFVSLSRTPVGSVTIPAGTLIRTAGITDPIVFQTLATIFISAGNPIHSATVAAEHSRTYSENYISNGLRDITIGLQATPYLDGSAVISATNGAYTEVENFLDSGDLDRHYVVTVNQNDRAIIRFGNGTNGAIPTGTITVSYKTGGGREGNIEAQKLVSMVGSFFDSLGNPVQVNVINNVAATGGENRDSVEQIRAAIPQYVRALTRTVAREDFEIHAREVAGVQRALMLSSDQDASIPENTGKLFIIPSGGGLPSNTLKESVFDYLNEERPYTITFQLQVQDPVYKPIHVQAKVYLARGYNSSSVKAAIQANLATFFALTIQDDLGNTIDNPTVDFGYNYKKNDGTAASEVAYSDIYNVVRDTPGVRKIEDSLGGFTLNGLQSDVNILLREFPILGTVTLINGDTNSPL